MVLDVQGFSEPWSVSLHDLTRLQVYSDRTRHEGFRHGALLGGAAGLFIGATIGGVLKVSGANYDDGEPSDQVVNQTVRGAVLGTVFGALAYGVYRARHPGRGWIGLELPER